MSSLRSWAGSFLSLVSFFIVRRFAAGFAVPVFVSLCLACVYLWLFVLRIPELHNIARLQDSEESRKPSVDATVKPGPGGPKKSSSSPAGGASSSTSRKQQPAVSPSTATSRPRPKAVPTPRPAAAPPSQAPRAKDAPSDCTDRPPGGGSTEGVERAQRSVATEAPTLVNLEGLQPDFAAADSTAANDGETGVPGQDHAGGSSDEGEQAGKVEEVENVFADAERAQTLKQEGNDYFKSGKVYDAVEAYSEAIHVTPTASKKDRAVLHSNRAACNQKLSRWEEVTEDCKHAIDLDPGYVKAYHRRSVAYEALNKWHDALQDLNKAIELDPSLKSKEYKHLAILEKRAQEQFDKDKEEMVDKLKDLGNMVLGKFGMSVDNFKMEKDPSTGSYSIQYKN